MAFIRAAFDLGSSHHKLVVALISPSNPPTILFSTSIRVPLADALSPTNIIPTPSLRASHLAFSRLHTLALAHRATTFCAVATAVFRTALNGPAHLKSLPVPVVMLDPDTEGRLAFASAMVAFPTEVSDREAVVWDSGGGSTQWAMRTGDGFHVRAVRLGSSNVRAKYRQERSVEVLRDWIGNVAGEPGEKLSARLRGGAVVLGIGSDASMFALAAARKGVIFGERDVWQAVDEVETDGEDEVTVLPKLVLLGELMRRYGIERVRYVPGNGSCVGLLASEEERFWGKRGEVRERRRRLLIGSEGKSFQTRRRHPKAGVVPLF